MNQPTSKNFAGRNALVTGGASGIGAAVAESLVKSGARVTIVDVNEAALADTGKRIGARAEVLDVSSSEAWTNFIASHEHFDLVHLTPASRPTARCSTDRWIPCRRRS